MLIQVLEMRRIDHPKRKFQREKTYHPGYAQSQPDLASFKTTVSSRIFLITVFRSMKKLQRIFMIIECKSMRKFHESHNRLV